jgi:uncharacterized RDD family membrane protein YckC
MFCSRCGKQVVEGNRFCQACGQEVGAAVTVATAGGGALSQPMGMGEGGSAPLAYAGFWERFAAALIDGLILGIPFWLVAIGLISMFGGLGIIMHRNPPADPREAMAFVAPMFMLFFLGMLCFTVVRWLYFAGMESSSRQATFGKSVMSLRVTNLEGQRLSFGHATGRFGGKIVSDLIPFLIGYIMAAFTEKKQALHDLIAGTLVLRK